MEVIARQFGHLDSLSSLQGFCERTGQFNVFAVTAQFLDSATVIMGIIVIGLFAFGFDLLIRYLERVLIPWKGRV